MRGFDAEFEDLPDYIIKITERIWEGRGVHLIRRWYAPDCVVHTSMGPSIGLAAVVAGTLDTLNAFPDRRLLPEDVIWSGDDHAGWLSSHRVSAPARHDGAGPFGPPTGREVHFRAMADCLCRENRIVEEWLTRDQSGIALQLGLDPHVLAAGLASADRVSGTGPWHLDEAQRLRDTGELRPSQLQDHPAAQTVREAIAAIWNEADLSRIRAIYHPAAVVHVPGNRTLHGHDRIDRWWLGHLAAFPDARLAVEHSIARDDPGMATRVATRWWMTATHAGTGGWGPPSGATVLMLGITHSEVVDRLIRNEWTVFDEVAVLKQIALHRG